MISKLKKLLDWCNSKNIKVTFTTSEELLDYAGMNPAIAKEMGFKGIEENEILIDDGLPEDTQFKNLVHELIEQELLWDAEQYWVAHKKALKSEKWPVKKVKRFVNKRRGKAPISTKIRMVK